MTALRSPSPGNPRFTLAGTQLLPLTFPVVIVSSGEDDAVLLTSPYSFAFLCPQKGWQLPFLLLQTGKYLISFLFLHTLYPHPFPKPERQSPRKHLHTQSGAECAVSFQLLSSCYDHFHSTRGWGFVAATELMNRSREKWHPHPRTTYTRRSS